MRVLQLALCCAALGSWSTDAVGQTNVGDADQSVPDSRSGSHSSAVADAADWQGAWTTDRGLLELKLDDDSISGQLGGKTKVQGVVDGRRLQLSYSSGFYRYEATLALDDSGHSFSGESKRGRTTSSWDGVRAQADPVPDAEPLDFSGHWLLSWGVAQLSQEGNQVEGTYGANGFGSIKGTVSGRRLDFQWKRIRASGHGWLEVLPDGQRLLGQTVDSKTNREIVGTRAIGYEPEPAAPAPGSTVRGIASNGMLYVLRWPESGNEPTFGRDAIVLLHGSNFTTAGMVGVVAKRWPEIAAKNAIIGIQGENWARWSKADDLRFNYTYVNWMGRSTYRGYPYTDRESPALVMEVIDEIVQRHQFRRLFVGGHSQGGYLTYVLHMHFPEKLAGTFPIAGGMIMQAEPDVFEDADLQRAQRDTPMVIVHGRRDRVVGYSSSTYAYHRLLDHDFHNVNLLSPDAGHPFDFLPIGDALAWLDGASSIDGDSLRVWAEQAAEANDWRSVGTALKRAKDLSQFDQLDQVRQAHEQAASARSQELLADIRNNLDSSWIDGYLEWKEQFGASETAVELQAAFEPLRQEHTARAKPLLAEARKLFREKKQDAGWEKYRQVVEQCYASPHYRTWKDRVTKHFSAE